MPRACHVFVPGNYVQVCDRRSGGRTLRDQGTTGFRHFADVERFGNFCETRLLIVLAIYTQWYLDRLVPCCWEPAVMTLSCQLSSMNLTNETLLFVRFFIMCDFTCFHLYHLHFYCIVYICDWHIIKTLLTYLLRQIPELSRVPCLCLRKLGRPTSVDLRLATPRQA